MTCAEILSVCRAAAKEHEHKNKQLISLAWHTAMFSRQDPLEPLETYIQAPKEQTPEQMIAIAKVITAALGGEVIEV